MSRSIPNILFSCSLLLPILVSLIFPALRLPHFSPTQLIYSKNAIPLLFAPWAAPSSASQTFSRIIQAVIIAQLPVPCFPMGYFLWVNIAVGRVLSGFLLSRSVGWAYPRLFNHWALYESSSGFGPTLLAHIILIGAHPWTDIIVSHFHRYRPENTESITIAAFGATLCLLDGAPWTYAVAAFTACVFALSHTIYGRFHKHTSARYPLTLDGQEPQQYIRRHTAPQTALLSLLAIAAPNLMKTILVQPSFPPMPASPSISAPLLEVLILSYPRPNDITSPNSILSRTISSFLPFIDSNMTVLSVFTHASPHASFAHAKEYFSDSDIQFYADQDNHPGTRSGQYLHIAEAFRWALQKQQQAEWVMLVEDDFPICGEWGWGGIRGVMNELERGRTSRTTVERRGGFVGTGGSGLIIHRSLLPVLTFLMRAHSDLNSPLLSSVRRPADLIIQDCLLGLDPLCPRRPEGGNLVITSKLAMDHVGGLSSTAIGRKYEEGKWKCGWRHPFHGRPEVVVIPI